MYMTLKNAMCVLCEFKRLFYMGCAIWHWHVLYSTTVWLQFITYPVSSHCQYHRCSSSCVYQPLELMVHMHPTQQKHVLGLLLNYHPHGHIWQSWQTCGMQEDSVHTRNSLLAQVCVCVCVRARVCVRDRVRTCTCVYVVQTTFPYYEELYLKC